MYVPHEVLDPMTPSHLSTREELTIHVLSSTEEILSFCFMLHPWICSMLSTSSCACYAYITWYILSYASYNNIVRSKKLQTLWQVDGIRFPFCGGSLSSLWVCGNLQPYKGKESSISLLFSFSIHLTTLKQKRLL